MEQAKVMDFRDLWRIVRKRKWSILIPSILIIGILSTIAYLLPAIYRSETLILIENQKIPIEYVRSTVTSEVQERLNLINQRIMSRTRLEEIIQKYDLYREYEKDWTREEIIAKMRNAINLEIISADAGGKGGGRQAQLTVAFRLAYEGKSPKTVQAVAGELASLYIGENLKVRVDAGAMTTQFVADELKKMGTEIERVGKIITDFKQKHLNELPEQLQVNMGNLDRYERYLETNHRDMAQLEGALMLIKEQFAMTDPHTSAQSSSTSGAGGAPPSSRELLEYSRNNLVTMQAGLSDNHPDIILLKKQIARLEEEVGTDDSTETLRDNLVHKERLLADLRSKYSEKHPDVIRIQAEVEDLKEKVEAADNAPVVERTSDPTNPAYLNLQAQIERGELTIKLMKDQDAEYKRMIDYYQQRVANTPAVEKALATLQSDYDIAQNNYRNLTYKESQAKISESLENRQQAERFTIIDPARLPEEPFKPNRMAILFIGLVLGIGAGAGMGFLAEYMDQSFSNVEDLKSFANLPVLAVIPKVVTQQEKKKKRGRRRVILLSSVIAFLAVLVVAQIFFFKFDIFLIKFFREIQKLPIQ